MIEAGLLLSYIYVLVLGPLIWRIEHITVYLVLKGPVRILGENYPRPDPGYYLLGGEGAAAPPVAAGAAEGGGAGGGGAGGGGAGGRGAYQNKPVHQNCLCNQYPWEEEEGEQEEEEEEQEEEEQE